MALFRTMVRNLLISDTMGNFIRLLTSKVEVNNLKFIISSKEIKGKIVSLLFFNKYEKEEIQMIRKHMRKDLPLVDLGSSLGVVALNALNVSEESIVCVEANPNLISIISDNFSKNGIAEDRFSVVNAAICDPDQSGEPIYFSSRGSNELGRVCKEGTSGSIRIETVLLSHLVEEKVEGDYVLISDVEGAEVAFLFNDSDALKNCQQLFIELHPVCWKGVDYQVSDLRSRIESLGFTEVEQRGMNFYYTRHENS